MDKCIINKRLLFNIYGRNGSAFSGNVWDTNYLCPTLDTMGGGNRQPMIVEIEDEEDYNL